MLIQKLKTAFPWAQDTELAVLESFISLRSENDESGTDHQIAIIENDIGNASGKYRRYYIGLLAQVVQNKRDYRDIDMSLIGAGANQRLGEFQELLAQGADINVLYHHNSVLLSCVASASATVAAWIADHSQEYEVDLDLQDRFKWDTLDERPGYREFVENRIDIADRLQWQQGPYLKNTALILALKKGWDHVDNQYTPKEGVVPLKNMGVAIQALVKNGADPNIQDGCGNTALHIAVLHRDKRAVSLLLAHGARKDIKNSASLTPADMLDVPYEAINPFLYQQCGNDTNSYIHTLQGKDEWMASRSSVETALSQPKSQPNLRPVKRTNLKP